MPSCPNCHQTISESARFCENCGTAVSNTPDELTGRVRELLAAGNKIEAIRVIREATGVGLAEAKQIVDSGLIESGYVGLSLRDNSIDEAFERELVNLLQADQKIEAIKRHRERTGLGLKESKDFVEGLARRHGIETRSGCLGVLAFLIAITISATLIADDAKPEKSDQGWFVHQVTSELQAGPTQIRVLLPDRIESNRRYTVLYVLPVEANNEQRYGDGLAEIKRCDIHNKHNLICVAPTFAHLPWYADHPTDKSIQQESYFIKEVVPLVDRAYPTKANRTGRWLLGFSKSGWGAWSLLIRHPDLFDRAAAWDAPMEMARFDQFGAGQVFGMQEHFETYRLLPALKNCESLEDSTPRLVLTGYDNFRMDHQTAHAKLEEWKIPHLYRDGPQRKHVWNSGWVDEAVGLLAGLNDQPQP